VAAVGGAERRGSHARPAGARLIAGAGVVAR
jgi:hypothetical protein